jgi:hypothetical protein
MRIFLNIALLSSIAMSCNLFETRNPEEPEQGSNVFLPQTSWEAVISNLEKSFELKATENYIMCLAEEGYSYQPSAEAANLYQGLFDGWDVSSSERRWFLTMSSNIGEGLRPELTLYPSSPQSFADSVIYTAEYTLLVPHSADNVENTFKGRLQFTFIRDAQANWRIGRWIDQSSDSTQLPDIPTFSHLKAGFYN